MGKAGKALKQVLETYSISQNKLAVTMGTGRPNIHRWINEMTDPVADKLLEIRDALRKINPVAADEFIRLYLGDANDDQQI
ncbi:helix-turn-helix transcriptional regulator [Nostoc sp. FACHB-87]|uniref:helix-turn-helix domain-containing protein n=2 Tax=Nostocales TaxID=1161 RepID=UPI001682CCB7|nr:MULTISPECIES: helix-turn-helix transcriptional regulator [Nostocaceae]MBD2300111.1 helix-turn-helix transcriptional regulator [Nostoc sp. FACHB-190]MBD2455586.1 helix-turn-helix transcriptional regulator [Nostoc sp. FACHB-87]MBD2477442.1 helix-turn-helix transcriptional regulator [Anabaena sp. FACHB-83]